MSTWPKKIEVLANVAIIVVAVLLSVVLAKRYLLPVRNTKDVETAQIKPGMKLSLPEADWGKSNHTLLMILSTNCHFCTESAPFYQRLVQEKAKRGDLRLIAVLPQSIAEAQNYLSEQGVLVDQVKQAALGSVYARGTPTLIVVDRTGSVVASWIGKLSNEKEAEVLDVFLGQAAAKDVSQVKNSSVTFSASPFEAPH